MFYRSLTDEQTLRVRRARPVMALAAVAFAIGAILGANSGSSPAGTLAAKFVAAWAKSDYAGMYAEIDSATRRSVSASEFAAAYGEAMRTATATRLRVAGKPKSAAGGVVLVPVTVRTRLFGTLSLSARVRVVHEAEGGEAIAWSRSLAFPGVVAGSIFTFSLTLGDFITPTIVGGDNHQLIGSVVYSNFGIANNAPFAAAFATVPLAIMAIYLLTARRLGAFDHL